MALPHYLQRSFGLWWFYGTPFICRFHSYKLINFIFKACRHHRGLWSVFQWLIESNRVRIAHWLDSRLECLVQNQSSCPLVIHSSPSRKAPRLPPTVLRYSVGLGLLNRIAKCQRSTIKNVWHCDWRKWLSILYVYLQSNTMMWKLWRQRDWNTPSTNLGTLSRGQRWCVADSRPLCGDYWFWQWHKGLYVTGLDSPSIKSWNPIHLLCIRRCPLPIDCTKPSSWKALSLTPTSASISILRLWALFEKPSVSVQYKSIMSTNPNTGLFQPRTRAGSKLTTVLDSEGREVEVSWIPFYPVALIKKIE